MRDTQLDRADRILTVRTFQAGDSPGIGGVAQGVLASVVYSPGMNSFASLVSQELGHTFGASVLSGSLHSPNATISTPAAFDLLNRRSIPAPRPFMHNPVSLDDASLFEVDDWNYVKAGSTSSFADRQVRTKLGQFCSREIQAARAAGSQESVWGTLSAR